MFIDESGVLNDSNQPYFAVGFLKILDTSVISEMLTQKHYDYFSAQKENRKSLLDSLKTNPRILTSEDLNLLLVSTRHAEYKFTNITHLSLQKYKDLVDTAFNFPLYFCALVIDKTDPLFDSTIYRDYWSAYIKYSKLLCENNCKEGDALCVLADYMNRPANSNVYFEKELNHLPNIFNVLRAHSETFTLLQICDLFLGSVLFQWRQDRGLVGKSNRAKAKEEFVNHLINKLNIPNVKGSNFPLSKSITVNNPIYFSVWPLKLSKTK